MTKCRLKIQFHPINFMSNTSIGKNYVTEEILEVTYRIEVKIENLHMSRNDTKRSKLRGF